MDGETRGGDFPPGSRRSDSAGRWLFRCDANESVGWGHLSRCLALAEAARQEKIVASFLGDFHAPALKLIARAGFSYAPTDPGTDLMGDARGTATAAANSRSNMVIADSYTITSEWLRIVEGSTPVVLIDDFCRLATYPCSGVINFTVAAPSMNYPDLKIGHRALGPAYFLARTELTRLRRVTSRDPARAVERLLVAIGGVDHSMLATRAADAARELSPELSIRALWSGESPPPARSSVEWILRGDELAHHYEWCDACLSGGGLIKYECAYLGVPAGVLSQTADQQAETLRFCHAGLALDLGFHPGKSALRASLAGFLSDNEMRVRLSEQARSVFPIDAPSNALTAILSWT